MTDPQPPTDRPDDTPGTDPTQRIFQAVSEASTCWVGGTDDLRAMGVNL
jgi:hypothetical protein